MKKKLKALLLAVFFIAVCLIGYGIYHTIYKLDLIKQEIQKIPEFSLKTIRGKPFSKSSLSKTNPTIFVFFNTECEFCQHEITDIQDHWQAFPAVQWIFVSMEAPKKIAVFAKQSSLFDKKNVVFLSDEYFKLMNKFAVKSFPSIVLYNRKQQLIKKHRGVITAKKLLKELNQQ